MSCRMGEFREDPAASLSSLEDIWDSEIELRKELMRLHRPDLDFGVVNSRVASNILRAAKQLPQFCSTTQAPSPPPLGPSPEPSPSFVQKDINQEHRDGKKRNDDRKPEAEHSVLVPAGQSLLQMSNS
uniref:Uncharacterized protein n=1 Tax=Chromera velia CCMP2878 TaxID=1169474 RepID=A0A0G4F4A0_9ALVE|eukprot:Cvel_2730.t1-p1 / transcript=Cvel_2730.t1 / gene=Cvel_2730 / organism=Chromera_velia_CCMP2878 / gene_product=hypothetical protein / transcript_product=hypothetical protein / location=Cvel_scaffold109:52280-52973(+) / protein_length=127 / sequence_SO=supercontig / SO=protein_coding / is_pseudo=false